MSKGSKRPSHKVVEARFKQHGAELAKLAEQSPTPEQLASAPRLAMTDAEIDQVYFYWSATSRNYLKRQAAKERQRKAAQLAIRE